MITDLRKLRQVVEVAQAGGFTAAARVVGITQSALTKSVADVESQLGLKLFVRVPRGVRLTDAGERFVTRAKQILADTEDLMTEIGGYRDLHSGRLRIGVAPAAYQPFLERPLASFAGSHPGVAIELRHGVIEEMASALSGGSLDLIVGGTNFLERWPDVVTVPLAELHITFIGRVGHPASTLPRPTERDLLGYPIVTPVSDPLQHALVSELYSRNGLPPRTPHYQCDDFQIVRQLVHATDAVSPVVSLAPLGGALRQEFHVFEGVVELGRQEVGVAHSRSRPLSPAAGAFRQVFEERLFSS